MVIGADQRRRRGEDLRAGRARQRALQIADAGAGDEAWPERDPGWRRRYDGPGPAGQSAISTTGGALPPCSDQLVPFTRTLKFRQLLEGSDGIIRTVITGAARCFPAATGRK